jgi:hypothetical protein
MPENMLEELKPTEGEIPPEESPVVPPETTPPEEIIPTDGEGRPPEDIIPVVIENQPEDLTEKLRIAEEERDNYRKAFLSQKNKDRMKEVIEEPKIETPNDYGNDNTSVVSDYQSKRADIIADYEKKFQNLSDDEFKLLVKRLKTEESILVNEAVGKNSFVARKHIQNMIDDTLDYINFKSNPKEVKKTVEVPVDIGSTKSVRKILNSEPISEELKQIAQASDLSIERVQELRKKGLI